MDSCLCCMCVFVCVRAGVSTMVRSCSLCNWQVVCVTAEVKWHHWHESAEGVKWHRTCGTFCPELCLLDQQDKMQWGNSHTFRSALCHMGHYATFLFFHIFYRILMRSCDITCSPFTNGSFSVYRADVWCVQTDAPLVQQIAWCHRWLLQFPRAWMIADVISHL